MQARGRLAQSAPFGRACHLAIHFGFIGRVVDDEVGDGVGRARRPGPTDSHMSIMPCSATMLLGATSAPASVSSRISARTRSGAVSATRNDTKPPWLMPADDGAIDAEVVEQTEAVGGRIPVGERVAVVLGEAEATLVPRDHAVLVAQRCHLRREHLVIHQEAVRQDHRRPVAAGVLEVDAAAR